MQSKTSTLGYLAAESATGCKGANSYEDYAEARGYKHIEVLNWSSSAGDWQFIVSKDGIEWHVLDQENNYPRPGFSHSISEETWYGTADEVLAQIQGEDGEYMEQKLKNLTKERIDGVFKNAKTQEDYIVGLYKIAHPDWDRIAKLEDHPEVSDVTNTYIFKCAIYFDRKNHPDVVAGGAWMNNGFSSSVHSTIPDWKVRPAQNVFYG